MKPLPYMLVVLIPLILLYFSPCHSSLICVLEIHIFAYCLLQLKYKLHKDWDFVCLIHCCILNIYNNK